uniref:U2A'/phosphoprotein 32 family A C-terminal domain-containing protein n=1 Tax=Amphora coffeiformis TaxID=265554 RepID=A0A7S3L603_9STRA|mmetsp:Transcript_12651/g.24324  ORF Transcript_12651/g.24324 Transcript_12651/m.24324 type:complete len:252 (+) Transcript_12651:64-819(+)|eukprot:scaffold5376_cov171-Amphora_coffeaeformis.AAC.4
MRITAELITELVEHRINDLEERELCLGGLGLVALEHLGAARNDFDAYDLSNNRIRRLENFPKVTRLKSLYVSNNLVDSLDANNLQQNVPLLQNLVLSHNAVADFKFLQDLGEACPKLEFLSLVGNPIARRPHYRLCVLHLLPHVKCLDYVKVKQAERKTAAAWAKSAAGKAVLQQTKSEETTAPTFTPGEGVDGQSSSSFVTAHFTTEQKAYIRDLLMSAESAQEIEEIENAVRRGVLPNKRARRVVDEGG